MNDTKANDIEQMFDCLSNRYDIANHILSLGADFYWRRKAVQIVKPVAGEKVLDICSGSGDLAFAFAKGCDGLEITATDFSEQMIELAKRKEKKLRLKKTISFHVENCAASKFSDEQFDIISCAFGVRNLSDWRAGLAESLRLLKKGGQVCILEFSMPSFFLIKFFYLLFLRLVVPIAGFLLSGKFGAYKYLSKSICEFSRDVDMPAELQRSGFDQVETQKLTFGVVSIYTARKADSKIAAETMAKE